MALMLHPETYSRLEKRFGKEEAREIVEVLGASLHEVEKRAQDALENIQQKADFAITQKKFELKDELAKELATKADVIKLEGALRTDIVRVEGEINTARQEIQTVRHEIEATVVKLDRKFTIMFLVLLFTTIFLNQNSLEFIAKLLGLIKP